MNTADKNELLFSYGINFNDLPRWQKRGIGLYWNVFEKEGMNPVTGNTVSIKRREIIADYDLPMKDDYDNFIRNIISNANPTEV